VSKMFPMGGSTSNWLTYLKSTHKIAIGSLNGRGSSGAGDKLKFEMYRKLSTVEVEDQITAGQCVVFTAINILFCNIAVHCLLAVFGDLCNIDVEEVDLAYFLDKNAFRSIKERFLSDKYCVDYQ